MFGIATVGRAQPATGYSPVSLTHINVRGAPVVLTTVGINADAPGRVVVHFDGVCVGDVGDLVTLAASDSPDWSPDDGNVSVDAYSASIDFGVFSHTRSYTVTPGVHVFYAVAENYVEQGGSGYANIYGGLSVEYFPDVAGGPFASFQGVASTSVDLRGSPVVLAQQNINTSVAGRAVVRFDGSCIASPGDRIVLAASNDTGWHVNDGATAVKIVDADINRHCFSHSRAYDIAAGSHDFYAVAQNYVDLDGTGIASVYGALTVEFYPNTVSGPWVQHQGWVDQYALRGAPVTMATLDVTNTVAGKVLVRFDGICIPTVGDMIVLAASSNPDWHVNDGNIDVEAPTSSVNQLSFSHSRLYHVAAGTHTFYAVGENYVHTGGTGSAWIYGNLTTEFFPDGSGTVPALLASHEATVLPGCNEITWRLSDETGATNFRIDREVAGSGDYVTQPDGNLTWNGSEHVYRDEAVAAGESYRYRVYVVGNGEPWLLMETEPLVAVRPPSALSACAPNPFNPSTTISFSLSHRERVRLAVYDVTGRLVRVLVDEARPAGTYDVRWDGRNEEGRSVASGVYVSRMEAADFREAKTMTLIR